MTEAAEASQQVPAEELERAAFYRLLAGLLSAPPDDPALATLTALEGDATPLGSAVTELAARAAAAAPVDVRHEYEDLFIGIGRGELVPFASYYLTGFLNERPLARLRDDMALLGIARAEKVREPEDHIAALCEMMAGLIAGSFGEPLPLARQQQFFDTHLAPWAGRFFADLEKASAARLYAAVGRLGRTFVEIETTAFEIAA
ncbi:molecular chaperone TorD family protein [Geminicoccaceae bacterium 1502E]|nr:molecular chaperone TorD family protein [Geminicoccaceae bacterium 1502E]